MNILFLNTVYEPCLDELIRRDNIQLTITGWHDQLKREWQLKRFSRGEIYLSKQIFHNGIRNNWKVFPGFKETSLPLKENIV